MTKKLFLVPAVLSLACLALAANSAHAQRRGGIFGGRSGGGYNQGGYGSFNNGGYSGYNNGFGNGYNNGYNSVFSQPGYSNWNGQQNYSYYPPMNNYGQPGYNYGQNGMYGQPGYNYVQPAQYQADVNNQQSGQMAANTASIRVMLPDAQARVWVDGAQTNQQGTERYFYTPSLTQSGPFTYQIRATWMQNGREMSREQSVSVQPGQTSTVDFTRGNNRDSGANNPDSGTNNRNPGTNNSDLGTNNRNPGTNNPAPGTNNRNPSQNRQPQNPD